MSVILYLASAILPSGSGLKKRFASNFFFDQHKNESTFNRYLDH